MDRTTLADELSAARFRTTRFRAGYSEDAVDDFIDALRGQLVAGVTDDEIVAAVQTSRFPMTGARRGYELEQVDALLDHVTTALGGTPAATSSERAGAASTGTTTGASREVSSAPLPSAVTEAPRGFLARLLGH